VEVVVVPTLMVGADEVGGGGGSSSSSDCGTESSFTSSSSSEEDDDDREGARRGGTLDAGQERHASQCGRAQSHTPPGGTPPAGAGQQGEADCGGDGDGAAGESPLPLLAGASLFAVQRALHRGKHDLRNRLHSIAYDAAFVRAFAERISPLPCFANLRQGAWYVSPQLATSAGPCCFKSSDGHAGQWQFVSRRLNLHVALAAASNGGVLVVDSTRGGKRIPDALSKTVPLWAAVLNRAVSSDE
jgi:hypothetical protein